MRNSKVRFRLRVAIPAVALCLVVGTVAAGIATGAASAALRDAAPEFSGGALEGVSVQNLTPAMARELKLPPKSAGVMVTHVAPSSAAAAVGIARGDVIREVNRRRIADVAQYATAVRRAEKQPVLLLLHRNGAKRFVTVPSQ
jgi:S1-C subfamily serine protease